MRTKKTFALWIVCLMCGDISLQAQEVRNEKGMEGQNSPIHEMDKQRPNTGGIPSPEKEARRQTGRMKEELGLTDKQYDKIYKLNLKEQRKIFEKRFGTSQSQRPPMGWGMGPGRPGEGDPGMRPGMGPGMGGGRPQMGGGPGGMRPDRAPRMDKDEMEEMRKAAEKKEKKIKKILTAEQYAKWQTLRKPKNN